MAGKQRTFAPEIREKIGTALDQLPEKPKEAREQTTTELVGALKTKIKAAQAKGYTLTEIVELFKQSGAKISLSTVKASLGTSPKRTKSTDIQTPSDTTA
ncbi:MULTISPECIES: hypothetical protein [Pseudomonas syringae group]|uniref:hypothetical protein n=1 Tax=Pseudomonas syringae group TaxID=136849 RepID=UPI0006E6B4D3|nr:MULTISPECIES: hypothetical protein [Pseudomonas syringae group]KPY60998.1 hypothetical protein ALO93_200320 [Pseudomonas amygdali pv. sesami]RMN64850.1 MobC [Pseudomonas syringae pv. papulans]RMU02794.1 hypothetical protein ALP37_200117 [Pseudomonas amygdali pv. sesami]